MLPAVFVFLSRLYIGEKSPKWWRRFTDSSETSWIRPVQFFL